jgi:hypothetical protein
METFGAVPIRRAKGIQKSEKKKAEIRGIFYQYRSESFGRHDFLTGYGCAKGVKCSSLLELWEPIRR